MDFPALDPACFRISISVEIQKMLWPTVKGCPGREIERSCSVGFRIGELEYAARRPPSISPERRCEHFFSQAWVMEKI